MKKKILVIIIVIILVILGCLGIFKFIKSKHPEKTDEPGKLHSKFIKTCLDEDDARCISFDKEYVYLPEEKDDSNVLKEKIKEINSTIDEKYNDSLKSNMDDNVCSSKKSIYNRRYVYQNKVTRFDTDDVTVLFASFDKIDLCKDSAVNSDAKVFYYDKNEKKFIDFKKLIEILQINNFSTIKEIKSNIEFINQNGKKYQFDNVINTKVYVTNDGYLSIYYVQKEDNQAFNIITSKKIN